jgi:prephenate dehydrogenase
VEEEFERDKFPIAIIGGTGGIGRWFSRFFGERGYPVLVSGRTLGPSLSEIARDCPVVIVAVPIGVTCEVIRSVGPLMKSGSLLMDLTSLKQEPVRAMLEASQSEVIGLHPLFGPGEPSMSGQNIVICAARGEKWLPWVRELLGKNGARLVEAAPERHDEIMAVVQGFNHLETILMGLVLREAGLEPEVLDRFSTPALRTKMGLIEKVFSRPALYAEIITLNPAVRRLASLWETKLAELCGVAKKESAAELVRFMERFSIGSRALGENEEDLVSGKKRPPDFQTAAGGGKQARE